MLAFLHQWVIKSVIIICWHLILNWIRVNCFLWLNRCSIIYKLIFFNSDVILDFNQLLLLDQIQHFFRICIVHVKGLVRDFLCRRSVAGIEIGDDAPDPHGPGNQHRMPVQHAPAKEQKAFSFYCFHLFLLIAYSKHLRMISTTVST